MDEVFGFNSGKYDLSDSFRTVRVHDVFTDRTDMIMAVMQYNLHHTLIKHLKKK